MVGLGLTAKQPEQVTEPPSGFVTLTSRDPTDAAGSIVMLAVSLVAALFRVRVFTVMPAPNEAPLVPIPVPKPEPLITTFVDAPCARNPGTSEVIVGSAFTVKALAFWPTPPSGLVTVTLRVPVGADGSIERFTTSDVPLPFTDGTPLTVIPVPVNDTSAPCTKPVPVIVTSLPEEPCGADAGLRVVIVGFGFTVKHEEQVAVPPPDGLVTRTSRAPRAAELDTATVAVRCVESTKTVGPTVTPFPRIATVEPFTNEDP
jgi:hypothetical protein